MSPHNFNTGAPSLAPNNPEFASKLSMDTVFMLNEVEREAFLHQIMDNFGCTYICLWSYLPHPSNCLLFLDGEYRKVRNQTSSLSGNLGKNFFDVYCGLMHNVDSGRIPGFAFKNKVTYMELKLHDLQRMASHDVQLQFYNEARIQMVVFMGCDLGEIELGLSHDPQVSLQVDMEMEMRSLFPLNSSQQSRPLDQPFPSSSQIIDQSQNPSSPSSSLRSFSVNSAQYLNSSLLLSNFPSIPLIQESQDQAININQELLDDVLKSSTSSPITMSHTTKDDHGKEDDATKKTSIISAVLSSPSSSHSFANKPSTAFRSYNQRSSSTSISNLGVRTRRNNMFKRAVLFFRNLNVIRRHELTIQRNQPTHAQLHHTLSERRRREKINESFQALRSLLPPGSKKDKASVLSSTTEYLRSLKSQVQELSKRNQILEGNGVLGSTYTMSEGTCIEVSQVATRSTSEARFLDLRVHVRGESCVSMLDLVVGILELLKQHGSVVMLSSIESSTTMVQSNPVHGIFIRLKIEGGEFDKSHFQDAVKRAVDDLRISRN